MADVRTYYCNIHVDFIFNAGNIPKQNIQALDEKIDNAVSEWATEMAEKGLGVAVGWDWSEDCYLE